MVSLVLLNLFLFLFLLLVIFELSLSHKPSRFHQTSLSFSPFFTLVLVLISMALVLALILYAPGHLLRYYIIFLMGFSLVSHTFWLSQNKHHQFIFPLLALLLFFARLYTSYDLIHNLFLIFAISWLGPVITQIKLINRHRFVVISLLWFLYDIVFVWVSKTSAQVQVNTENIGFPLGLTVSDNLLGTGDLLWSSLFLSILPSSHTRLHASLLLLSSNIILNLLAITLGFYTFPLLVLWVPLGILYLNFSIKKPRV